MPIVRVERRLAAIMATDIVAYSRLIETDEARTLAAIRALRSEVLDPLIADHKGRIVKLMGDGAIVEFRSVVDAVACAVALQERMVTHQREVPTDSRIVLRIRAKSSTLGPPQPPDDIPEELSRMVDAEVAVADGETAVLGGLMREGSDRSSAGVPYLRSVPLLGLLFGKRIDRNDDEELVVLVTPHLIQS